MKWLLSKLRGRHRSLRFRFWEMPKEALKLRSNRLRGRSWIDYYAERIDTNDSEALPEESDYLDVGKDFLAYLQDQGLRAEHHLLDYGCGILRGGLQLVPYLQPGRYVGVEISARRLQQGRQLMDMAGIPGDAYTTILVRNCSLIQLEDRKFNYIWAHAVLMHMPEDDIRTLLASLKKHMNPGAQFHFTFFPSERFGWDRVVNDQIRDFYYPTDYIKGIFEAAGYDFDIMPKGYKENWGTRARATLKSDLLQ